MKTIIKTVCFILIVNLSAFAANYAVKSNGSGNYTTIQSCASAMASGDTCTVYAGTYNENVTVPAGATGNYKTITVNGSDVVTVNGFPHQTDRKLPDANSRQRASSRFVRIYHYKSVLPQKWRMCWLD
jgi:pectin methylesterase-like acyl-CoA thioesterase